MPKLTGRYAFLEQLVANGVTYVFGNPGTTEQAFIDALQDYPQLRYILALHESVAVGIADGYARATDRPVLSVIGDGAALYTIQALWTAAHHRVPVTWVIANNASYRILKLNMLEYLGEGAPDRRFVAMDLTDPPLDFSRIAASFGVKGVHVEHPDQIGDAVREAQTAQEPRVVDIVIDGDISSRWL